MNPKDRVDIFNKISKLIDSKHKAKRVISRFINKSLDRQRDLAKYHMGKSDFGIDIDISGEFFINDIYDRLKDMHYTLDIINNETPHLKVSISRIFIIYMRGLYKILHFKDVIGDPKRYDKFKLYAELNDYSRRFFNGAKPVIPEHPNDTYNCVFYTLLGAGIRKDDVTILLESYKVTSSGKKAKWSKQTRDYNLNRYKHFRRMLDISKALKDDYDSLEEMEKPFK